METKKIMVIFGHPSKEGFCFSLLKEYLRGVKKTENQIKTLYLLSLPLESHLKNTYKEKLELKGKILKAQKDILWADHLVLFFPVWWATPPALMKVFLEVVLQRRIAYQYKKPLWGILPRWDKLLKGKSARIVMTLGAPSLYYKLIIHSPAYKMMEANLNFCGVTPVKAHYFGSVDLSSENKKKKWLKEIHEIGKNE